MTHVKATAMLRLLPLLMVAVHLLGAEGWKPNDPAVTGNDGKGQAVVLAAKATGPATWKGATVGNATLTVTPAGTMTLSGLEGQGIRYAGPYHAKVASSRRGPKKVLVLRYDLESAPGPKDSTGIAITLSWELKAELPVPTPIPFMVGSLTVTKGTETKSLTLGGGITITAVAKAP